MLYPTFLKLGDRRVLLVGGGRVAASKLRGLLDAGAIVKVVAPTILLEIASAAEETARRPFRESDLDDVCFVVAAAPAAINREVAAAARQRGLFVNAVDDVESASAYAGAVLRRAGVTIAISTDGDAPALAGLAREALEAAAAGRPRRLDAVRPRDPGEVAGGARSDGRAPAAAARGAQRALRAPRGGGAGRRNPLTMRTDQMHPQSTGFVSLVGAGPGDPDLLTRRAARRLEEADLVLYDALVDPEVLSLAGTAQRIFVGKRAGRPQVGQEFINRLLIRAARRGRHVVRLKGGDPFVFGRGGEEALALVAAGIPFEVVPGVSSAIAAPELAGIPVTHRGTAAAFVVVSGHAPEAYSPLLSSLAPQSATVVVMMGLGSIGAISSLLIERGWAAGTPAAIVTGAATAAAQVWIGTLADLPRGIEERLSGAPGTIVIGDVVRVGAILGAEMQGSAASVQDAESLSAAAVR